MAKLETFWLLVRLVVLSGCGAAGKASSSGGGALAGDAGLLSLDAGSAMGSGGAAGTGGKVSSSGGGALASDASPLSLDAGAAAGSGGVASTGGSGISSGGGALAGDAGPLSLDAGSDVSLGDAAGTAPGRNPITWPRSGSSMDVTCASAPSANVTSIAVGPSGDIYLAGDYSGPADFGSGPLPVATGMSLFLTKFDPGGNPVWAQSLSGFGPSVQVDHDGRPLMAVSSTAANGGGTGTLRQFDPASGAVRWRHDASWTADYGGGVALTASTDSVLAIPGRLVKLDNGGHVVWNTTLATQAAAGQGGYPLSLVEAQNGNLTLYAVDYVTEPPYTKYYRLTAFDPAGNQRWTRRIDGVTNQPTHMAGNAQGTTAVFGLFDSSVAIEGASPIGLGSFYFLGIVDVSGNVVTQRDLGYLPSPSAAIWDKDNLVLARLDYISAESAFLYYMYSLGLVALTADGADLPMADPALPLLESPTVLLARQGDSFLVAGSRGTAECWDTCPCHQPRPYLMRIGASGTRDPTFGELMP